MLRRPCTPVQEADFCYLTGILQPGVAVVESLASHPPGKLTLFLPRHTPQVCRAAVLPASRCLAGVLVGKADHHTMAACVLPVPMQRGRLAEP